MQYFQVLSLALLPAVLAQYGSSGSSTTSSSASTSTAAAVKGVHVVKVGQNGLTFEPSNLTVPVGESVEFHFWPKAHSVAQSSFAEPCQPLNKTEGFFSGPIAVASGMSTSVYTIKINSTSPVWFYCATGSHCQSGMSGVINQKATGNKTIAAYQAAAKDVAQNVTPPSIKGGVIGTAASASDSGSSTSSGTAASSPTATPGAAVRGSVPWFLLAGAMGGLLI